MHVKNKRGLKRLTNEQLEIIGNTLAPLFQYLEQEIIADTARRVKKTLEYTRTAELQALSLYKLGYSPAYIRKEAMKMLNADKTFRKEVAKNTLESKNGISKLIQEITNEAYKQGNKIVANAGDMSWYNDLSVWKQGNIKLTKDKNALSQLVKGIQKQLKGDIKGITKSTGFKGLYGFESVRTLYKTELDKAVIKLLSGTSSQDQVIKECIHSLAVSGLRKVDFASGRSDTLDTAVARAVRTGCHQVAGEIQNENIKDTGVNLVIVQSHAGARNEGSGVANHAEWQGKVYYIEGGHDYSEEAKRIGQDTIEDLWEKTGYSVDGAHENNPLGLFGYNCRHLYFPFFEGVSEMPAQPQKKPDVTYNGKKLDYYAQTQEARKQERNIRNLKRERDAYKNLKMDAEAKETSKNIEDAEKKYESFCKRCKMPTTTTRTNYESGTGDLTKTEAYKKFNSLKNKALNTETNSNILKTKLEASKGLRTFKASQGNNRTVNTLGNHRRSYRN